MLDFRFRPMLSGALALAVLAGCAGNPASDRPSYEPDRREFATGTDEDRQRILNTLRVTAQRDQQLNRELLRSGQTVNFDGVRMRWEPSLRLMYVAFEQKIAETYQMAVPLLVFPTDSAGNITGCGGHCSHAQPLIAHVIQARTAEGENVQMLASILGGALQGTGAAAIQRGASSGGQGAVGVGSGQATSVVNIGIQSGGANPL